MPIFKDNYFTNDTYLLRLERLKILHNYINDWASQLSVPESLIQWAENAYEIWKKALEEVGEKKQKRSGLFEDLKEADETTFKFYLKFKRFLSTQFLDDFETATILGIQQRFPRKRNEKILTVKKLIAAENLGILKEEFMEKLKALVLRSEDSYQKAHTQNTEIVTDQATIYQKDSKKLRALYSWALMHWEADQPYLVQLGFAVKTSQKEDIKDDTESDE